MRFVLFTHSLVSDWNHGNAHFLRGILRELVARGHDALACEPADGWSRSHLLAERGEAALTAFAARFPELRAVTYGSRPELDRLLDGADVVIVHEWTDPALVSAIGSYRAGGGRFALLFHDTHHRAISAAAEIAALDLDGYDAVLAFGTALAETYCARGWGRRVFTWHEAADTRMFRPQPKVQPDRDLIWIGNWGDGERNEALRGFLVEPVRRLGLRGTVYGVRYPESAERTMRSAGLAFRGWLANADVPDAFARHRATVHVPRGPYMARLPGIPTIRVFEALACGIPLVSAPWDDIEGLFRRGDDYLVARTPEQMCLQLARVLNDRNLADALRSSGRQRILSRHSCAHRVDELFAILAQVTGESLSPTRQVATA